MRKLFLLLLLISGNLSAQNLVPNPSFECGQDDCEPDIDASRFIFSACSWSCPTSGTTDAYSTQIPNKACFCSMPYTGIDRNLYEMHLGSQSPRTGNRFVGIYTYSTDLENPNYREYLQVKLNTRLTAGEYYCGKMYVTAGNQLGFISNNLGMYFGSTQINLIPYEAQLPFQPQVVEKEIIPFSYQWTEVSGSFKATDSLEYLIIGNFYDDISTQFGTQRGNPANFYYGYAYYFIDDVSVEKLRMTLTLSQDTVFCADASSNISVLGDFDKVNWYDLTDTTLIIGTGPAISSPDTTTTYLVKALNCGFTLRRKVTIHINPLPKIDLGPDKKICQGSSTILDAGDGFKDYTWQDGSKDRYLSVTQAGAYSVTAENELGCSAFDLIVIEISSPPSVDLGRDTLVCKNPFPLIAGSGKSQFYWSSGSTDSTFTPQTSGTYWVTVSNPCGQATDSINVYRVSDAFIPNVITVNNDRVNDQFQIIGIGDDAKGRLKIYNRWGQMIFSDDQYNNDWPRDELVAAGVYYYTIGFMACPERKGWVQVIR